jgi:hypothetical protein
MSQYGTCVLLLVTEVTVTLQHLLQVFLLYFSREPRLFTPRWHGSLLPHKGWVSLWDTRAQEGAEGSSAKALPLGRIQMKGKAAFPRDSGGGGAPGSGVTKPSLLPPSSHGPVPVSLSVSLCLSEVRMLSL